jgi:hypothetical protein
MRRKTLVLVMLILAMALAAGCTALSPQATPPPPTKTPKPTFTATADWSPTPVVFPTATPVPATPTPQPPAATDTPAPTEPPPTPTPNPVARLVASQTVNVRQGPGTNYPLIGKIEAGQSFEVTGKNPAGNWLQFSLNDQPGWVSANLVDVSGESGTVQVAQNIPAPPAAPTARPRPQPTTPPAAPAPAPAPAQPQYPFTLVKGVERCDPNAGTTYVNGFVRYRNNSLRNAVCVHIAFYGPRNTKCSGCDGVGDGLWGFSPFGGPAPAGTTVEVFVVPCPSNVPPGGVSVDTPGGFGNLTPQSEKWVHTFSQSEQCTGVTFAGD